jgi:hypothetical protein
MEMAVVPDFDVNLSFDRSKKIALQSSDKPVAEIALFRSSCVETSGVGCMEENHGRRTKRG